MFTNKLLTLSSINNEGGFVLINTAYAMGQGGSVTGQGAGGFASLIPIILMFVIFYFLLIRPQQKKAKEHRQMISHLKKGDRIITSGGLHGRVTAVSDTTMTVEIADKVRVKIARGNVAQVLQPSSQPQVAKKNKTDAK
jgi:preprotein translocase subunit YajC